MQATVADLRELDAVDRVGTPPPRDRARVELPWHDRAGGA